MAATDSTGLPIKEPAVEECRFYRNELPSEDQLVVVRVEKVKDFEAFVSLLEYQDIEGMILLSEVSRRRIRSIHKHLRTGKKDVMQVLRVDSEKGYVDLSKKYVTPEDFKEISERYIKSKTVYSIMQRVARLTGTSLMELQEKVAWHFYDKYDHALTGLSEMLVDPSNLDSVDLPDDVKEMLIKETKHRLAEKPARVSAQIDVTCFTKEGIEAIKPSLNAGKKINEAIEITLLRTPTYRIAATARDEASGIKMLNDCIKTIEKEIKSRDGTLAVKEEPQVME